MEKSNRNKMAIKFLNGGKYILSKNHVMEQYNKDFT